MARLYNGLDDIMSNYSRIEMSTEFFLIPLSVLHNTASASTSGLDPSSSNPVLKSPVHYQGNLFRREVWVPPLLVLSLLTIVLIVLFEVFVLRKTWKTVPSRRHLFLGQMLLMGLFICSIVSTTLMTEPSATTCAIVRFGASFGYSLIFSSLLVKCIFLISLNDGVYLPAPYQALLLFFAVAIQVAINVQWLVNSPPTLVQGDFLYPVCEAPYHHILLSLVYVIFLIVVVTILSLKSRTIRDNYREAMYICITMCCVIPVWFGWIASGLMTLERNRDACLAFGLSITSIIVFLIMFMPKSRQLAAMGREGMCLEDREEKFSSLNPPASPAFYQFQTMKPSALYNTTSKGQISAMNTYGDHIALVATPTSYAHHCCPCCYYPQPYTRNYPTGSGAVEQSLYSPIEPTLSSNPNVFFHRNTLQPNLMY